MHNVHVFNNIHRNSAANTVNGTISYKKNRNVPIFANACSSKFENVTIIYKSLSVIICDALISH